jgi:hypothetical protein
VRTRALLFAAVALIAWRSGVGQAPDSTAAVARRRFWVEPVASLLVPGSGQFLAHQHRAAVYVAVELYALARFLQLTLASHRNAARFRDLAFQVARSGFAPTGRDTTFEYFETMERFTDSGQFDRDAGPAFAPEADTATYNGSVWLLARRTFWSNVNTPPDPTSPAYARAVQFYEGHAVGPGYLWSWRDAAPQLGVFRETIRKSDNAFRSAQNQLGLLLANHLMSALDVLISHRLASAVHRRAALRTTLSRSAVAVHVSVGF